MPVSSLPASSHSHSATTLSPSHEATTSGAHEKGQAHPSPSDPSDVESQPRHPKADQSNQEEQPRDEWEVSFDGESDPVHPQNRSLARKWVAVGTISLSAACVTCASSMAASTYDGIESDLDIGSEVAVLSVSLFVAGLGVGPLLLGPLSEFLGRNKVYFGSFIFFILFNLPVAFAPHVAVEMIFRFLTGFAGSAFLSVAGGSVADMFSNDKVGPPMGVYTVSPFIGPILGPLISGFINQNTTWRWTYYVIIIWASLQLAALMLFVPETHVPTVLVRKACQKRKDTGEERWYAPSEKEHKSFKQALKKSVTTPFRILATEPMALMLNLWTAILLGILYLNFNAFPFVFRKLHGFSLEQSGLSFLGIGIGMVAGVSSQPIWNKLYLRSKTEHGGVAPPEARLYSGMAGALLCPLGVFLFSATSMARIHWAVPMVMSIPFGIGVTWCFQSVFTFLVDAYRPVAASAMASNSFMRSSFAAGFPLFANQMYTRLGSVGAGCLLGGLLVCCIPLPFLFFHYGERIRKRSKFAQSE